MPSSIIQFGTSRFLQAHADLFVHEARAAGQDAGTIAVVAGSGSAANRARLAAFDDPAGYPVVIRGLADGIPVEKRFQVRSVVRGLDVDADWAELLSRFVEDARFVISNTTESGISAPPGLVLDLSRPPPVPPPSYPGRLLALLAARFAAKRPGLTVLPTELIHRNGEALRSAVTAIAVRSGATRPFLDWLDRECVFANSLVDRIVSEPMEPAGAVAEPYALWAIEARPGLETPCRHPAIQVVDDLEPVERLKIHILNLGHTVLAERWSSEGSPPEMTVRSFLAEPRIAAMLEDLYSDEVIPGFDAKGMGASARNYVASTLDRFRNPFLRHRLADIAENHAAKVDKRIRGFLEWTGTAAPRLEALVARHPLRAAA